MDVDEVLEAMETKETTLIVKGQNLNVVTGTFLFNDNYSCILFDSGAEKSFVSSVFTPFIDIAPAALNTSYEIELADGKVVSTNTVLRGEQGNETVLSSELSQAVENFSDVFEDAIEFMVKELLDSGVVRPSQSPFASPIVMNQLFAKKTKCMFGTRQVEHLGHVISTHSVATNPSKIVAMQNWPTPVNIKQLRGFLGLTGYYRKFIKNFASLSRPFTQLLKKGAFKWSEEAHNSFEALQLAMTQAPVLTLLNFTKSFVVETCASGIGIGAVLQQDGHPIAYLSKALAPKHQILSTYEKEFLAVMMALERWRGITTPAQMKWLPKLMGLIYELMATMMVTVPTALFAKITASWTSDASIQTLLHSLQAGQMAKKRYTWSNGQLLRKNKLVISKDKELRRELMAHFHGSSVGGHSGVKVTTYIMSSMLYWKGMRKDIKKFFHGCIHCQRNKPDLAAYPGLLQPLPIPNKTWESISMDFSKALPRSQGYTIIFVVVDRLTKYAHFMSLSHPFTAAEVAQEFLDTVYKLHGLPTSIVSDRDNVFLSNFWKELFKLLQVKFLMSTTYHPQTDGHTEERPNEWKKWLSLAELWYNSNFHTSIQTIPFEAVYGQPPPVHVPHFQGLTKEGNLAYNSCKGSHVESSLVPQTTEPTHTPQLRCSS
nr:hypothetical protein [Tanacetum cinerariifolium]